MSSRQRDAHGSPFGTFIIGMNVGDREIRARWVGSSAELARDHQTFTGPYVVLEEPAAACTRRPAQSVLVEEHGAMVLVGDVEVLCEGTTGHEASCRHPRLEATGPWWQADWWCRRDSAVRRRPRWRKTPASAASPRARLCRRCRSGGRCTPEPTDVPVDAARHGNISG